MSSSVLAGVLAGTGEVGPGIEAVELPIPAIGFGLITLALFMLLLGITYSFKNVAARR